MLKIKQNHDFTLVSLRPQPLHFINTEFANSFSFSIVSPQHGHCIEYFVGNDKRVYRLF